MNEKIREFAKDADLDWHKHWNDDESNRLQNFAELIIRECSVFLKDTLDDHFAAEQLVEHFEGEE